MSALVLCLAAGAMACSGVKPTVRVSGDPRAEKSEGSIADVLAADKDQRFTTLLSCVELSGTAAAVTGTGPVTVFAPTNAAFAKAGVSCTKDTELTPAQSAELARTIAQHVTDHDVRFAEPEGYDAKKPPRGLELVTGRSITLESLLLDASGTDLVVGSDKTVAVADTSSKKARIVDADVQAPNGIIQVIDAVLIPPVKAKFPPTTAAPKPFE